MTYSGSRHSHHRKCHQGLTIRKYHSLSLFSYSPQRPTRNWLFCSFFSLNRGSKYMASTHLRVYHFSFLRHHFDWQPFNIQLWCGSVRGQNRWGSICFFFLFLLLLLTRSFVRSFVAFRAFGRYRWLILFVYNREDRRRQQIFHPQFNLSFHFR